MATVNPGMAGGVGVLVITAAWCVREFLEPWSSTSYRIAIVVLATLLLILAWLLTRFIKRHGDEIGEARFDTRNPDERDH